MAQKTKEQLKNTLVDGHLVTGEDFTDIIDSLKGVQSPVANPSVNGNSTAFIDSIVQNAEGRITATRKNVNFSGYQTVVGMASYQENDKQQVGDITGAGETKTIVHNMKHYPTVRIMDAESLTEINPSLFTVKHNSADSLDITLDSSLSENYKYLLD